MSRSPSKGWVCSRDGSLPPGRGCLSVHLPAPTHPSTLPHSPSSCSGNDDGCGEGTDGPFDMSFMAQANTHYFFAASPFAAATPIAFRLNVTARLQPPPVVPASPSPPPPAVVPSPSPPPPPVVPQQPASGTGSWSSPITITSLPFTSADLAVSPWAVVHLAVGAAGMGIVAKEL